MQLMQVYSQKSTSITLPCKSLNLNGLWLRHSAQVKSGAGAPTRFDSGAHRLPAARNNNRDGEHGGRRA